MDDYLEDYIEEYIDDYLQDVGYDEMHAEDDGELAEEVDKFIDDIEDEKKENFLDNAGMALGFADEMTVEERNRNEPESTSAKEYVEKEKESNLKEQVPRLKTNDILFNTFVNASLEKPHLLKQHAHKCYISYIYEHFNELSNEELSTIKELFNKFYKIDRDVINFEDYTLEELEKLTSLIKHYESTYYMQIDFSTFLNDILEG